MPTVVVQPTLATATGWADQSNLEDIDLNLGTVPLSPAASAEITFNCQHTLPAGATVTGIRVQIAVASSASTDILWETSFASFFEQVFDGNPFPQEYMLGSTSNAYGVTRASLAAGFTILVTATEWTDVSTTDAGFDGIEIEVTYTEPAASNTSPLASTILLLDE